jgi:hydroxymethylpyrimidine/phosphomethylpyrimidine kinase
MSPPSPHVLVIAGLDPSGGAGLLADVRTLADLGVGALGVATALTEQGHAGVAAVNAVDPEIVGRQVAAALAHEPVDAVKIGMLGRAATARAVATALAAAAASRAAAAAPLPVVLDPVLRATSGAALLEDDATGTALAALVALLPHATLVTPNAEEAALLADAAAPATLAEAAALCARLRARGARAVLLKGGHLPETAAPGEVVDLLDDGRGAPVPLRAARQLGAHGTGCALASAVAAGLAAGQPLEAAVRAARDFLARRLQAATVRGGTRYLY